MERGAAIYVKYGPEELSPLGGRIDSQLDALSEAATAAAQGGSRAPDIVLEPVDLRPAIYVLAEQRVAKVALQRGIRP